MYSTNKGTVMNIRFTYLYRDAANYKQWGEVIFLNPKNMEPIELEAKVESVLIDQTWFYASGSRVPDLHFDRFDPENDHDWHEFNSFECTNAKADDAFNRSVDEFIEALCKASKE